MVVGGFDYFNQIVWFIRLLGVIILIGGGLIVLIRGGWLGVGFGVGGACETFLFEKLHAQFAVLQIARTRA